MSDHASEVLSAVRDWANVRVDTAISEALARRFPFVSSFIDWSGVPGARHQDAPPERARGAGVPDGLDVLGYVPVVAGFIARHVDLARLDRIAYVGDHTDLELDVPAARLDDLLYATAEIPEHRFYVPLDVSWCVMWTFGDDLDFGPAPRP